MKNKTVPSIVLTAGIIALILICMPLIIDGIAITMSAIFAAIIIAGVFLLGIAIALAITSPLWIPFLAGWAAVQYCKQARKKTP